MPEIKDQLIKNTDEITRGNVESVPGQGEASGTNDPDRHFDVHRNRQKFHKITQSPPPDKVFAWQREHIRVHDQSAEGYPLNVIVDPAMREMYQHVNA